MSPEQDLYESFTVYLRHLYPDRTDQDIRPLYEMVPDKAWLAAFLKGLPEPGPAGAIPLTEEPRAVETFAKSRPADLVFQNFIFGGTLEMTCESLNLMFEGSFGGLGAFFIHLGGGTLYYDSEADLRGKSDFQINGVGLYTNINYIRNGRVYATYQGTGMPSVGILGGRGKWGPRSSPA